MSEKRKVVIDFETYFDKEISVVTQGTVNYVKSADAYIVGIYGDGVEGACGTIKEMSELITNLAADPNVIPVAANSNFDQAWEEKYWCPFQNEWLCILDQSCYNQGPRNLAQLTGTFLGKKVDKGKRDEMKGVHYEDLSEADQIGMQEYCLNDCIQSYEALQVMPAMTDFEARVASHTRMINRRGVHIDTALVESDKTKLEEMRHTAFHALPWYRDAPPLSYTALVRWCGTKNIPVPKSRAKTDDDCTDLMTDNPELGEVIRTMRRYTQSNTMLKKIGALNARTTTENVLPLDILYCGAPHTRRWSSKGFNVQNLDKEPVITNGSLPEGVTWDEVLSGTVAVPGLRWVWTRNWLIPKPGYIFGIYDFAQVEPRCLNYLVENEDMMVALRNGFSYYEAYAAAAKGWKGAPGTIKKELGKLKYTKLKNEALGCGFGMGATKYQDYASVTPEEAAEVIKGFRATNPKVVNFWHRLDKLIAAASRDKSKHLVLDLPSGESLQYFNVRSSGRRGYEGFVTKGDFGHNSLQPRLWGGTLTENVTQRFARDCMANAILNIEAAGIPVRFHVHDEIIVEMPIAEKEKYDAEVKRIMRKPPEYAPDLPLDIEGDFAMSYTK